jgi:hypothetical protein
MKIIGEMMELEIVRTEVYDMDLFKEFESVCAIGTGYRDDTDYPLFLLSADEAMALAEKLLRFARKGPKVTS